MTFTVLSPLLMTTGPPMLTLLAMLAIPMPSLDGVLTRKQGLYTAVIGGMHRFWGAF